MWVRGGNNRAVARAAFADLLPRPIFERRSKGGLESLFVRRFEAQRDELRDLLLGGGLRDRGLLDAEAIEACLAGRGEPCDEHPARLFELAALELWLRAIGG